MAKKAVKVSQRTTRSSSKKKSVKKTPRKNVQQDISKVQSFVTGILKRIPSNNPRVYAKPRQREVQYADQKADRTLPDAWKFERRRIQEDVQQFGRREDAPYSYGAYKREKFGRGNGKWFSMNIKQKLLLIFVIVSVLSIGIVGFLSFDSSRASLELATQENLLNLVEGHAQQIDVFLFSRMQDVLTLTQADIFEEFDAAEGSDKEEIGKKLDQYFEEISEINPFFESFFYIDLDGNVIAASHERTNTDRFEEDHIGDLFRKATAGRQGDVYISDLHLVHNINDIEIDIAAPVTDDTNRMVIGILYGSFSTTLIHEIVQDLNDKTLGDEDSYLINKNGEILSIGDDKTKIFDKYTHSTEKHFKDVLAGNSAFEIFGDPIHEQEELVAYTPLKGFKKYEGLGWSLLTVEPAEDAFAAVNKLKSRVLLVGLIVTIFVIIISNYFSNSISRPLNYLKDMTTEIGRGNLDLNIYVKTGDELEELASSFNQMTKNLKAGREQITKNNEELTMTNEELQTTAEELKSSNEEMQAANEELKQTTVELEKAKQQLEANKLELERNVAERTKELSTKNEELQSTAEELKSSNEEMQATNEELKQTTKQLEEAKREAEAARSGLETQVKDRTRQLEEAKTDLERQVQERTNQLQNKLEQLEKFSGAATERELKMIELKKKVKELEAKLGKTEEKA